MSAAMSSRRRERGPSPLSARTRRKLLADLHHRALAGDAVAAAELIKLSGEPRPESRRLALAPSASGTGS
jgi:hypothetical protein